MEILTLTFEAILTDEQRASAIEWLRLSRPLWNFALSKLEELDDRMAWDKESKTFVPRSRVFKEWDKGSRYGVKRGWNPTPEQLAEGWGRVCPVRGWEEPLLETSRLQAKGAGLSRCSREDVLPFRELAEMPSKFRMGVLAMLDTPWQEYVTSRGKIGGRGKPRYKSVFRDTDRFNVLYSPNLKRELRCLGDELRGVPKLRSIIVPGLNKRWRDKHGNIPPIAAFRLMRDGDRWKVQLSGEIGEMPAAPPTTQAIGIDPGLIYTVATSRGYRKPENLGSQKSQEEYQAWLQQQIDHKADHRALLWLLHPQRAKADIAAITPISEATWRKLAIARTHKEIIEAIGPFRFQRIKHRLPRSAKEQRLRDRLRKHQQLVRRREKSWDDWWSTHVARKNGYIAIEDGLQVEEWRHRPESKTTDEKTFGQNGAERKSEITKRFTHAAPGRKIELLKRKADRYNRAFVKVPAAGTSIYCPVCGSSNEPSLDKNNVGDRLYQCKCGWHVDRDIHAGVNVELAAFGLNPDATLTPLAQKARTLSDNHPEGLKAPWRNGVNGYRDAAIRDFGPIDNPAKSKSGKKGKKVSDRGGSRKQGPKRNAG